MRARGAKVDDWSWRATVRRVRTLARLAAAYKARTGFLLPRLFRRREPVAAVKAA